MRTISKRRRLIEDTRSIIKDNPMLRKNDCWVMLQDGTILNGAYYKAENGYLHPYILSDPMIDFDDIIYCICQYLQYCPDVFVWSYRNVPETRPYLKDMFCMLKSCDEEDFCGISMTLPREIYEITGDLELPFDERDFRDKAIECNDILNQNILRIRHGGKYRNNGSDGWYFRVSSTGFDWTDLIFSFGEARGFSNYTMLYISRDPQATGENYTMWQGEYQDYLNEDEGLVENLEPRSAFEAPFLDRLNRGVSFKHTPVSKRLYEKFLKRSLYEKKW